VQAGPAGLTVTDAADAPAATKQLAGYGFGLASASYSESATVKERLITPLFQSSFGA
jgi:hypothetical protein